VPRIKEESIAEHSFFVASLVVKLHDEYEFNLGKALEMAIVHDWTESYTDDITVATKTLFPELAAIVSEIELKVASATMSPSVFDTWSEYKKQSCVESKIVKYADTLQVMQYSANEISLGNSCYMRDVYNGAVARCGDLQRELEQYKILEW
jgi:5'-deoxynucleotidase YfbR-like HD superfamily hydrolase